MKIEIYARDKEKVIKENLDLGVFICVEEKLDNGEDSMGDEK